MPDTAASEWAVTKPSSSLAALVAVVLLLPLATLGAVWSATPAAAAVVDGVDWGDIDPDGAPRVGDAPDEFELPIYMNYELPELLARASQVSNPDSVLYGDYRDLTAAKAEFGADLDDQLALDDSLAAVGAAPQEIGASHTFARTPMTVAQAEKFFDVTFGVYRSGAIEAILPDSQPALPATLNGVIDAVYGLVAQLQVSPSSVDGGPIVNPLQGAPVTPGLPSPGTLATPVRTGVPEGCAEALAVGGFAPNQLATAYGYDSLHNQGLKGQGQRLAVLEINANVAEADITTFNECFGLEDVTELRQVNIGGEPPADAGDVGEATLDVQVVAQVAPELEAFELYSYNDLSAGLAIFLEMLVMPLDPTVYGPSGPVDIVSVSYGECEQPYVGNTPLVAMGEQVLAMAAIIGTSYFIASGDTGSATCFRNDPTLTQASVSYPASTHWATAVGGTGLSLSGPPFTPQLEPNLVLENLETKTRYESAWNDTLYPGTLFLEAGGGGGTSELTPKPSWQSGPGVPDGTARLVPDLAMYADVFPGWTIYCTPAGCGPVSGWQTVGGTSAATPLAAAMTALLNQAIDQAPMAAGRPKVGFFNPALYDLVNRQYQPETFKLPYGVRDVTTANNDITNAGCCDATVAYDLASGWGSLYGSSLIDAWLATPGRPTISGYTSGYAMVRLTVQAPVSDAPITGYEYTTDAGATWVKAEIAGDPDAPNVQVPLMGIPPGANLPVSVRALNESGPGLPSEPFQVRADGAAFYALAESERVLDTRTAGGPVQPGTPVMVDVMAPAGAVAVAYNLTVTGTVGSGYAVVYPADDSLSGTSTVNWSGPNQTRVNSFVSGVDEAGQMAISVAGSAAQVVLDVQGYYVPLPQPVVGAAGAARVQSLDGLGQPTGLVLVEPTRAYDSRTTDGPLATGSSAEVAMGGIVPPGATAVAFTITETGTQGSGFLAVGIPGQMMPPTSVLNWTGPGVTMANTSVAALDVQRAIEVYAGGSGGSTQVIIDVVGYFISFSSEPSALAFAAIDPQRSYDSRREGGPLGGGESRITTVGVPGMPLDVPAVAVNLTVTGTEASGFLTLAPASAAQRPLASTINWTQPGTTIANGTIVGAVDDAIRSFAAGGSTQYITDIAGYYSFVPVG